METNGYRLLLPEGTLDYFTISKIITNVYQCIIYNLVQI